MGRVLRHQRDAGTVSRHLALYAQAYPLRISSRSFSSAISFRGGLQR
jgi:hypothetical protein